MVKQQAIDDITAKLADKSLWSEKQEQWFSEQNITRFTELKGQLQVEAGWEVATEVVLSHLLAGHILEQLPSADDDDNLTAQTLCVLFTDNTIREQSRAEGALVCHGKNSNSIASKVSGVDELTPWLNSILLATNYANAIEQLSLLADHESLICPDGTWLSKHLLRKGKLEQGYDYISLQSRFDDEQKQLQVLSANRSAMETELAKNAGKLVTVRQQLLAFNEEIKQHQNKIFEVENTLSLYQQELKHNQHERESLLSQISNEEKNCATTQQQLLLSKKQLENLLTEEVSDSDDYAKRQTELQVVIEKIQQRSQELYRQRHQFGLTIEQLKSQQVQKEQAIRGNQESINMLTQRLAANSQIVNEGNTPLQELQQNLPQWLDELAAINEKLQFNQKVLNDSQTQLSALELALKTNQNKVSVLNEQHARLQLDSEGFKLKAENAMEVLTELQQNIDSVVSDMPEHAKESLWQAQLIKLVKDIQLLGAINLAAIEEYETQYERKNYLDQQDQDLNNAVATLESAIAKIDKESRHKFKITFDQINNDLQILFPKVFGGGQAYLALTGEDLLDTGVTIMARPPGKKNSTIHLLSGGEKALTALSLVFAIFRLNPAPFCLLDEVDAPLDDANVSRFCNLVQEMSKTVQFIYISHNKIAMEMASHLTGVTMFEPGVSRMVAVDIDEAIAMSEV